MLCRLFSHSLFGSVHDFVLFICRPTQVKWQLMVASCYRRSGKFCNFFVFALMFVTFFCNSLRLFSWENNERVL